MDTNITTVNASNTAAITTLGNTVTSNAAATTTALGLKEDAANKSTTTTLGTSNVLFPTQNAVKTYVDTNITNVNASTTALQATLTANATAANNAIAAVQADVNQNEADADAADLVLQNTITSNAAATATALGLKEDAANKSSDITLSDATNSKFPSELAVKTYVNNQVRNGTATNVSGVVAIANGGTGATTITGIVKGNGTSPMTAAVAGTDYIAPDNIIPQYRVTVGSNAGINTTGGYSVSIGRNANKLWNGSYNTAVGSFALETITSGSYNQAFGDFALQNRTSGSYGTAIGAFALQNVTTGSFNTSLGTFAGDLLSTGRQNTLLGHGSDPSANNSINQTVIGYDAVGAGDNTVQLGNTSVTNVNTSGTYTGSGFKTPTGNSSQYLKADGSIDSTTYLTAAGTATNVSGVVAIANGGTGASTAVAALTNLGAAPINSPTFTGTPTAPTATPGTNTTQIATTAFVTNAVTTATSGAFVDLTTNQTIAGNKTFSSDIVVNGIKVGNGGGSQSTVIGDSANATQANNTALGFMTLDGNSGTDNTAVGTNSMRNSGATSQTTAIGENAGTGVNTGNNNTYLGFNANVTSNSSISNATAIGSGATVTSSNTIQLGADGTNGTTAVTNVNTSGSITANASISSEITANLTITNANAELYKGKVLICNPSSQITITFNNNLPVGFNCMVLQKSADANKINLAGGSGVTIKNRSNYTATAGNYAIATIVNIGGGIIVTAGDMQ